MYILLYLAWPHIIYDEPDDDSVQVCVCVRIHAFLRLCAFVLSACICMSNCDSMVMCVHSRKCLCRMFVSVLVMYVHTCMCVCVQM